MTSSPRQLTTLLESLTTGHQPLAAELTLFSDLDREETEQLRAAWPRIPAGTREQIVVRATELAEDNVDLDFDRLAGVALDDPDATIRRHAVASTWESSDRAIGRRLTGLLQDDPDEQVRADAASALGGFVLQRELEALNAAEGDAIVDALRAVAKNPAEPVDVRAGAVESLGFRSLPWVATLINDAYYDDDRRLRVAAMVAMGRSADISWLDLLDDDARSDDPEFRFHAASAFGAIGSEDAVDTLAELLEDEDTEVLLAALLALGEIGGAEAVRYLEEYIEVAPPEFAEPAQVALETALFVTGERGDQLLSL
ncbi:MAG: HEAT repeat domain-containing protein [Dehalococcoidia bacterium]|nr:HEAT repeat domain-containing protein [Dehalococcoidia bacterium]